MPRRKYYFKFIVDNDWRFSDEYPQACDEMGNLNNYLDTRDRRKAVVLSELDTIANTIGRFTSQ